MDEPAERAVSNQRRVEPGHSSGLEGDPNPCTPSHLAALWPQPPHYDFCPELPSPGLPSPPPAPLSLAWLDTPLGEERSAGPGAPPHADWFQEPLLGAESGQELEENECPICTEPYGPGEHRLAQLNCRHSLCQHCLERLLGAISSADLGRVCCPLCRQKTPMVEWAICRLQEELLQADGPQPPPCPEPPVLVRSGPGPWAALEHRYQRRFLGWPVGNPGCLPFLPCPLSLGARLWALRERGPCARRLALLSLLSLELLGLLLVFSPLMLLGLLFVLLDRASR
ncbi:ring finger protein-like [Rhynchocyon petersi]